MADTRETGRMARFNALSDENDSHETNEMPITQQRQQAQQHEYQDHGTLVSGAGAKGYANAGASTSNRSHINVSRGSFEPDSHYSDAERTHSRSSEHQDIGRTSPPAVPAVPLGADPKAAAAPELRPIINPEKGAPSGLEVGEATVVSGAGAHLKKLLVRLSQFCRSIAFSNVFQQLAVVAILLASFSIGAQTFSDDPAYAIIDEVVLWFFFAEVVLKLIANIFEPWMFFLESTKPISPNYWHVFDFTVVVVMFLQYESIAVVRLFRILRVTQKIKALRVLMIGLFASIRAVGYTLIVLGLLYFFFGVVGMILFLEKTPEHFGDLGKAIVSLFSASTLDGWGDFMYATIFFCEDGRVWPRCRKVAGSKEVVAMIYWVAFIVISSMLLWNLVIGIITTSMEHARKIKKSTESGVLADEELDQELNESDNEADSEDGEDGEEGEQGDHDDARVHRRKRKRRKEQNPFVVSGALILMWLRLKIPELAMDQMSSKFNDKANDTVDAIEEHSQVLSNVRLSAESACAAMQRAMERAWMMANGYKLIPDEKTRRRLRRKPVPKDAAPIEHMFKFCDQLSNNGMYATFNLAVVVAAAITTALRANPNDPLSKDPVLDVVELIIKFAFLAEAIFKFFGCGYEPWLYLFREVSPVLKLHWWNILDMLVIIASFMEQQELAILRLLRLLRVLKLIKVLTMLQQLLTGLISSFGALAIVFIVQMMVYYAFAITGINLFRGNDPLRFGNLTLAMLSLFQASTMDDWPAMMYTSMYGCQWSVDQGLYPLELCTADRPMPFGAVAFFIIFEMLSGLVILNLIIGIISSSMEDTKRKREMDEQLVNLGVHDRMARIRIATYRRFAKTSAQLLVNGGRHLHDQLLEFLVSCKCLDPNAPRPFADLDEEFMQQWSARGQERVYEVTLTDVAVSKAEAEATGRHRDSAFTGSSDGESAKPVTSQDVLAMIERVCGAVVSNHLFQQTVFVAIVWAAFSAGMQTDPDIAADTGFDIFDKLVIWFLFTEIVLRFFENISQPQKFLFSSLNPVQVDMWNIFDFIIVILMIAEVKGAAVVRLIRLFRWALNVKALKSLLIGMFVSMASLGYVLVLMMLLFYIMAIGGMELFHDSTPLYFGDLSTALITLFQVSTLADWSPIMYTTIFECDDKALRYPDCIEQNGRGILAVFYWVFFVLTSALVVLNLVVGVITHEMRKVRRALEKERLEAVVPLKGPAKSSWERLKWEIYKVMATLHLAKPAWDPRHDRAVFALNADKQNLLLAINRHEEQVERVRLCMADIAVRIRVRHVRKLQGISEEKLEGDAKGEEIKTKDNGGVMASLVEFCSRVQKHALYEPLNLLIILGAAIIIGIQANPDLAAASDPVLETFKLVCIVIFVIDGAVKLLCHGLEPWLYFFKTVSPLMAPHWWNLLDFVVIVCSFLDLFPIAVIKLSRLLMAAEKIGKSVPTLNKLLAGLKQSMSSLTYVAVMLAVAFYIFAIAGLIYFKDNDPLHFGTLPRAMYTLLQVSTLDGWIFILYTNMYGCQSEVDEGRYPQAQCNNSQAQGGLSVAYFFIFALLCGMVFLNLMIGVITAGMEEAAERIEASDILRNLGVKDVSEINFENYCEHASKLITTMTKLKEETNKTLHTILFDTRQLLPQTPGKLHTTSLVSQDGIYEGKGHRLGSKFDEAADTKSKRNESSKGGMNEDTVATTADDDGDDNLLRTLRAGLEHYGTEIADTPHGKLSTLQEDEGEGENSADEVNSIAPAPAKSRVTEVPLQSGSPKRSRLFGSRRKGGAAGTGESWRCDNCQIDNPDSRKQCVECKAARPAVLKRTNSGGGLSGMVDMGAAGLSNMGAAIGNMFKRRGSNPDPAAAAAAAEAKSKRRSDDGDGAVPASGEEEQNKWGFSRIFSSPSAKKTPTTSLVGAMAQIEPLQPDHHRLDECSDVDAWKDQSPPRTPAHAAVSPIGRILPVRGQFVSSLPQDDTMLPGAISSPVKSVSSSPVKSPTRPNVEIVAEGVGTDDRPPPSVFLSSVSHVTPKKLKPLQPLPRLDRDWKKRLNQRSTNAFE